MDLAAWGIDHGYWDTGGTWREIGPDTADALLRAMGAEGRDAPPTTSPTWFVGRGESPSLNSPADLVLEDGATVRAESALPPDLPSGYHDLRPLDGGPTTRLIVSPRRCHLPDDLRVWGWAVQLYAARSHDSWGMGDLGDLTRLAAWMEGLGAGVVAVNPLHAAAPALPQQASPYYPTSRRWRNPLFLRVEDVPGAADAGADLDVLAKAGRALNEDPRIDRDEIFRLKSEALTLLWARFAGDPAFDRFCEEHGDALEEFAVFCTIAERHGGGWHDWPAELQRPDSPAVAELARAEADRVAYHRWLQWLVDEQLAAASAHTPVVQDLAIGFDPSGADAWAWQDLLALDASVGAPPDEFNTQGQDWGLPPFVPWKLRASGYEPFIETIRLGLLHAGGLRVDHVMGLFRLFWIPRGLGPQAGAYVRYPASDLLDILAIESERSEAFVVGEDLGTIEDDARHQLAERRVLSYRLLWFEDRPPSDFPEQALAAVTTHDLPTIAGAWTGADLEAQRELGLQPNEDGMRRMRQRLLDTGVADDAPVSEVVRSAHRALADAPSRVLVATLDDALCVEERPNMPGTTDQWPNWSIPLPAPVEQIVDDPGVLEVARILGDRP